MTPRRDGGGSPFSSPPSEAGELQRELQPGRRDLLLGLAGGAIGLGLGSQARAKTAGTLAPGDDGTQDSQPFFGLHQSGVTTAQPAAAFIASFDVLAEDRAGLARLFRTLTERIAFLMEGGEAASLDPRYPAPDDGLLGPRVFPDNLTVTVALGASLFDERYGLQKMKPSRLITMEGTVNLSRRWARKDVVRFFGSVANFAADGVPV
jgi:deferrochelatase/peroxidase EfeB